MRLDKYLSETSCISREQAKKLIASDGVTVNGKIVSKPAYDVSDTDKVEITGELCPYVSRGGLKLEGAVREFNIDIECLVCADIGASTGGFTDCMLSHGAKAVYAVDVGHGQLDKKLLADSRVIDLEGVNVRYLAEDFFEEKPRFIGADLSFISLKLIMPALIKAVSDDASFVLLIKPQFEAGKQNIGKNGIVKDKKVHIRLLEDMLSYFFGIGLSVLGLAVSPITGGDGNIEYLAYLKKTSEPKPFMTDIKALVDSAFTKYR